MFTKISVDCLLELFCFFGEGFIVEGFEEVFISDSQNYFLIILAEGIKEVLVLNICLDFEDFS